MRPVISVEVANALIDSIPEIIAETGGPTNASNLKDKQSKILQTNDLTDLVQLIKTVQAKGDIAESKNKKMGQTDKTYMRKAEELLYAELALALDLPRNGVQQYMEKRIGNH